MKIAVITGASSGLGKEFAKQIEALKSCDELWLVARREERLNALADALMTKCRIFPFDLTDPKNADDLAAAVKTSGATVEFLVNAAGFGKFGDYSEVSRADARGMIDLNARALADVTAAMIPFMKRGSHIIEIASISAYLPLENLSVYAATKAFVLSYSYALRAELKKTGITVTAAESVKSAEIFVEFFGLGFPLVRVADFFGSNGNRFVSEFGKRAHRRSRYARTEQFYRGHRAYSVRVLRG